MAHARTAIRDAAVTALTGLTTTGANVFKPRKFALSRSETPALSVDIQADARGEPLSGDRIVSVATLRVEAYTIARLDEEDTSAELDTIEQEVSKALFGSAALAALVHDLEWISSTKEYERSAEDFRGMAVIEYGIVYRVDQSDPSSVIASG